MGRTRRGGGEPRAQSEPTEALGTEGVSKRHAGSYERGADTLTSLVEISPLGAARVSISITENSARIIRNSFPYIHSTFSASWVMTPGPWLVESDRVLINLRARITVYDSAFSQILPFSLGCNCADWKGHSERIAHFDKGYSTTVRVLNCYERPKASIYSSDSVTRLKLQNIRESTVVTRRRLRSLALVKHCFDQRHPVAVLRTGLDGKKRRWRCCAVTLGVHPFRKAGFGTLCLLFG